MARDDYRGGLIRRSAARQVQFGAVQVQVVHIVHDHASTQIRGGKGRRHGGGERRHHQSQHDQGRGTASRVSLGHRFLCSWKFMSYFHHTSRDTPFRARTVLLVLEKRRKASPPRSGRRVCRVESIVDSLVQRERFRIRPSARLGSVVDTSPMPNIICNAPIGMRKDFRPDTIRTTSFRSKSGLFYVRAEVGMASSGAVVRFEFLYLSRHKC
jgi:hypothetical protein